MGKTEWLVVVYIVIVGLFALMCYVKFGPLPEPDDYCSGTARMARACP